MNLVISGIFIDSCDSIESVYSCESGASSESDKNGYSIDSVGSDQFGCYVKFLILVNLAILVNLVIMKKCSKVDPKMR